MPYFKGIEGIDLAIDLVIRVEGQHGDIRNTINYVKNVVIPVSQSNSTKKMRATNANILRISLKLVESMLKDISARDLSRLVNCDKPEDIALKLLEIWAENRGFPAK